MYKTTITYENLFLGLDGEDVSADQATKTEVLYFHLSKAQLFEMELECQELSGSADNGLAWRLQAMEGASGKFIMDTFKWLLVNAYGKKVGDAFRQSPEISAEFMETQAFGAFLDVLISDPGQGSKFVNNLFPKDLQEIAEQAKAQGNLTNAVVDGKVVAVQNVNLPDDLQAKMDVSGLAMALGPDNQLVPWWNREATAKERTEMSHEQLMDLFHRKSSGWTPPTT